MNYRVTLDNGGGEFHTLADILPTAAPIKMLIVGKTPAPVSVASGHYFQGRQGQMFWNKLRQYELLDVPAGSYEDEALLEHGYGLTDIVKRPRDYGLEPSSEEYQVNAPRILMLVQTLRPQAVLFVYKGVLDKMLKFAFRRNDKAKYGYNPDLTALFKAKVFAFPMPGTPCRGEESDQAMLDLRQALRD